jgi:hypothetical protein
MKKLSLSLIAMLCTFSVSTVFAAKCRDHKEEAACSGDTACHWKKFKNGKGKCMNAPKHKEKHAEAAATTAPAATPVAMPAAPAAPAAAPAIVPAPAPAQ